MQTLLRLEVDPTIPGNSGNPESIDALLRRHLHYSSLTTIQAVAAGQIRQYLWTSGCPGCSFDRCLPGCHTDLLRRGLYALSPAFSMHPIPAGFAPRQFAQGFVAWPTPIARIPTAADLQAWPEYRLSLTWQRGNQPRLALLWLIGSREPAPQALLRQLGWRSIGLPTQLVQWHANQHVPSALPYGGSWAGRYQLLDLPSTAD
jgi:hypothetical protein